MSVDQGLWTSMGRALQASRRGLRKGPEGGGCSRSGRESRAAEGGELEARTLEMQWGCRKRSLVSRRDAPGFILNKTVKVRVITFQESMLCEAAGAGSDLEQRLGTPKPLTTGTEIASPQ